MPEIKPIAHIYTDFSEKFGIPRQSGQVESLQGKIVFLPEYRNPDSLRGLDGFSHLWLIFDFSKAHRDEWSPTVRPPRLGGNKRMGVFATRSPFRPNPIGLSCVKFLKIEKTERDGTVIYVHGADLLDGTPIYDIKPYLPYCDSHPEAVGGYTEEIVFEKLKVDFPQELLLALPEEKRQAAIGCLAEDPRPAYQNKDDRAYHMVFAQFDISFRVTDGTLTVFDIKPIKND